MEHSRELIEKDLREAYESYKLGMTDKETYLEQRKIYEQMLEHLQENIEKQMAAVTKMTDVDVPEVVGLEMLEGQLKLTGLNREMVDAFVEEIVVYAKDRVEIKWKFKDEFWEGGKCITNVICKLPQNAAPYKNSENSGNQSKIYDAAYI